MNPAIARRGPRVLDVRTAAGARQSTHVAGFFVNIGIGGSFLAFGGLWAVPWLEHAYGMSRVAAAQHGSALLLGVAFGALAIGVIWDRLAAAAR